MDLEDHGRIGRDGALVVRQVRAVGGADLDEFGARSRHDVGNTEAATDLDELATAHDDLFARGMGGKHQQHRGGIVVDDQGIFGSGKLTEEFPHMIITKAPFSQCQIIL